ncbi:sarcosine oxidase subunit gamma [Paracoccus ravus]|uniref:sarcosine oxidase subunit gamma n=1 Tax=Paracoccus ravus TaxID=2447760 RepID=UPI00106EFB77|nr:sarcosine oxidase subunit gamma family protein [Paracoccus ravus]
MAEALARITEISGLGMIQIRAVLSETGPDIAQALGIPIPERTGTSLAGARRLCWMSPDELLLVLPRDQVAPALAALAASLAGRHALVLDVSDMRVGFLVQGPSAGQVLAKLTPANLSAMPQDGMLRSRAAQVACAIWRQDEGFAIIGFRSVADYLRALLVNAASAGTSLDPR